MCEMVDISRFYKRVYAFALVFRVLFFFFSDSYLGGCLVQTV